jgi:hypothetical protein
MTITETDPLALKIRQDLSREATNREEWFAIKIDLCEHHYTARQRYSSDVEFGRWFDQHIGDLISHQERAAYIAMGEHLEVARQVLRATTRSSIRMIYEKEFRPRFTSVGKPTKPRKPQSTDEYDAAMAVIERRFTAGESLAYGEIEHEAGISSTAVRRALAAWDAKQAAATDFGKFLSSSATEKLEAAIRQHKKQLDLEFQGRVQAEVRRVLNEVVIPQYGEKLDKADTILKAQDRYYNKWFAFSAGEYRQLLGALHPDANLSADKKSELFQLFKSKETVLVNPNAELLGRILRTVEEMMARRDQVRAENSRRAKEAAAKRKAQK